MRSPPANEQNGRRDIGLDRQQLPLPPLELLSGSSLFLDLDGTLLELVDRPDEVKADTALLGLLRAVQERLDGRLAIISGRSLEQVDAILGEIAADIALSGSHGCEHRWQGVWARPIRPATLDRAAERIRSFVDERPGLLMEEKSFGVALHYRMNPDVEADARALSEELAQELGLSMQPGKMMVELRAGGGDKGRAIQRLMSRPPMQGTTPVFIGDDLTDEPGFAAVRELGGYGILIGPTRTTVATYGLPSPRDLRAWLAKTVR